MKKNIAAAVIIASVCGVFGGREILAENTTSHAVKKGDTLWDISDGYLDNPLLWPKIWKFNPRITNPHLILPGQVVKIPGVIKTSIKNAPVTSEAAPVESGSSALALAGLTSSSEPLPIIVAKKDIPVIVEQAGMVQKNAPARYYDRGIGMITNDIPGEGRVLHTVPGWNGAARGEIIRISAPGAQVGQQFGIYRDLGKVAPLFYFDESPGHLLADIAIAEIVASDATGQQAIITQAFAEVKTDDLLGRVPEQPMVSARPGQSGTPNVKGEVVAFHLMRQLAGPDDILYLNVGAANGLAPGDVLSVKSTDQTEGRASGEIMILRVAVNTAAAVVTSRSAHDVRRGDVVGPPAL